MPKPGPALRRIVGRMSTPETNAEHVQPPAPSVWPTLQAHGVPALIAFLVKRSASGERRTTRRRQDRPRTARLA